jgi:hypothetical protein
MRIPENGARPCLPGQEEGWYYAPDTAPLAIRALVVIAIRNSVLEEQGADISSLFPAGTAPLKRDRDVRPITAAAIRGGHAAPHLLVTFQRGQQAPRSSLPQPHWSIRGACEYLPPTGRKGHPLQPLLMTRQRGQQARSLGSNLPKPSCPIGRASDTQSAQLCNWCASVRKMKCRTPCVSLFSQAR